ncbi:hypothetical protein PsYK624_087350 [Phanerochaete sordida]|uniref:Uncharacterized protein n=1 Tax=Phanerochaete sordida TaxID=48140 RepID=A0A9P3GF22_9APHY|nr:hypothetical protein PsYK624_087350 [Phanerochaete sordida]
MSQLAFQSQTTIKSSSIMALYYSPFDLSELKTGRRLLTGLVEFETDGDEAVNAALLHPDGELVNVPLQILAFWHLLFTLPLVEERLPCAGEGGAPSTTSRKRTTHALLSGTASCFPTLSTVPQQLNTWIKDSQHTFFGTSGKYNSDNTASFSSGCGTWRKSFAMGASGTQTKERNGQDSARLWFTVTAW